MTEAVNNVILTFSLFKLRITVTALAGVSYAVLALVATVLAAWLAHLSLGPALVAGVLSAVIFFVSEWLHQAGHALAAAWVGYPMRGIHFFSVLSGILFSLSMTSPIKSCELRNEPSAFFVSTSRFLKPTEPFTSAFVMKFAAPV